MKTLGTDTVYPATEEHGLNSPLHGLSKREHFAALALQGILAAPEFWLSGRNSADELAVRHADALIEALNKGKGEV